jgi:virginiamycin B lyase
VTRRGTAWTRAALVALAIAVAGLLPSAAAGAEPVFYELPVGVHAYSMTPGPDGKVWFTGREASAATGKRFSVIGSVDESGKVELVQLPEDLSTRQIAAGPDGNLWVAGTFYNESGYLTPRIGRLTPGGAYAEFVPTNRIGGVNSIAAGPDGAVWFTLVNWVDGRKRNAIGRIDSSGAIVQYPLPFRSGAGQIVTGPDGNLWFTEAGGGVPKIGRITPAGRLTHFRLPNRHRRLNSIAAGPDGNLWFGQFPTSYSRRARAGIGRITPAGKFSQFRIPGSAGSYGVTAGPDRVWFGGPLREGGFGLGSITAGGTVTPLACLKPRPCEVDADALTVDAACRLWFSMSKYYSHGGGGGTGLMEGIMEEREAGFVGFFP